MRHAIIVAVAALALAGCHKSVDQQFAAACDDMKVRDPLHYEGIADLCKDPSRLTKENKIGIAESYAELVQSGALDKQGNAQ